MAVSLGPKARAEHALRDHDKRGALMTVWEEQGNRSSLFETKGRTYTRGTVQLARTRDTPRAKQSCTEYFRRTSHTAHHPLRRIVGGPSPVHHM